MAKSSIWMPIYIGDYLADTMHLSLEEHGAYMLAIMHYWKQGGSIPKIHLQNLLRCSDQTLDVILTFFSEKKGLLFHKRIEEELKRAENITEARSKAGKISAEKRRELQQNFNKTSTNAQQNIQQNELPPPSPSPLPLPSKTPSTEKEGGVFGNLGKGGGYDINLHLTDTGRTAAKKNAPGWDIYYLIRVYNEGIISGKRSPPDVANAAFPAWCAKYTKGREP